MSACPFTVQEHLQFCRMVQNYLRFFSKLVQQLLEQHQQTTYKRIAQSVKPEHLLRLIRFPLLQLVDTKDSKVLMVALKQLYQHQHQHQHRVEEYTSNKVALLLEGEFRELERMLGGPLEKFEDFSSKLPDAICYETRVQEISEMIEKRDAAMLEPIQIMGQLLLVEGLIDCYRYSCDY